DIFHFSEVVPSARFHEREDTSIFSNRKFADQLQDAGVKTVDICGFFLDACIEVSFKDGLAKGYELEVLEDLSFATTPPEQAPALARLSFAAGRADILTAPAAISAASSETRLPREWCPRR